MSSKVAPTRASQIGPGGFRTCPSVRVLLLIAAGLACLCFEGCVPSDGPLASVVEGAAAPRTETVAKSHIVFDVVKVDGRVARSVERLGQPSLARIFGLGSAPATPVIGVGDQLGVLIFESGPDGLFSTALHKSTEIVTVVQPDGYGQIPYAGRIRLRGKTLEEARINIVEALRGKAVEVDVTVSIRKNTSRTVSVQGAVNRPQNVELGLAAQPLTSVLAAAGGPAKPPYETYVTLTRGPKSSTVLLQDILEHQDEDIFLRGGDKVFLTHDPRTFTALGNVATNGRISFETSDLTLVEAAAMTGGMRTEFADPKGFFVFRYESEAVYRDVVGNTRFEKLLSRGMMADAKGRFPIVYQIDMDAPQSYLVTQEFPVRNRDVLYVSRHPSTDLIKFIALVSGPVVLAKDIQPLVVK